MKLSCKPVRASRVQGFQGTAYGGSQLVLTLCRMYNFCFQMCNRLPEIMKNGDAGIFPVYYSLKILQCVGRGGGPEITVVATGKRGQRVQDIYFVISWRLNHWTTECRDSVVQWFNSHLTCSLLQQQHRSAHRFRWYVWANNVTKQSRAHLWQHPTVFFFLSQAVSLARKIQP